MTREDIIRMAREASEAAGSPMPPVWQEKLFMCFAALVAAAEREACAHLCESMRPSEREFDERFYIACTLNADAIRARGDKPTTVIYSPGQLAERGLTHEDVVKLIRENT